MIKQLKEIILELIRYFKNKNDQMESVWIGVNDLPTSLGENLEKRLETFTKYRKMGIIITNKTQTNV